MTKSKRYGIINVSRGSRENRLRKLIGRTVTRSFAYLKGKNEKESRKQPIDGSKTLYRFVVANTTEK